MSKNSKLVTLANETKDAMRKLIDEMSNHLDVIDEDLRVFHSENPDISHKLNVQNHKVLKFTLDMPPRLPAQPQENPDQNTSPESKSWSSSFRLNYLSILSRKHFNK